MQEPHGLDGVIRRQYRIRQETVIDDRRLVAVAQLGVPGTSRRVLHHKVPVSTIRGTERERGVVARIRTVACAGQTDTAIAEQLEREGFTPCRGGRFTAEIVSKHRGQHQIRSGLGRLRRGERPQGYTIVELAQQIGIDPTWIYRGIAKGRIEISKDSRYGCYLFPRTKAAVARMRHLKCGKVREVTFRKGHRDD
jgi:hypothetical protein